MRKFTCRQTLFWGKQPLLITYDEGGVITTTFSKNSTRWSAKKNSCCGGGGESSSAVKRKNNTGWQVFLRSSSSIGFECLLCLKGNSTAEAEKRNEELMGLLHILGRHHTTTFWCLFLQTKRAYHFEKFSWEILFVCLMHIFFPLLYDAEKWRLFGCLSIFLQNGRVRDQSFNE